MTASELLWRKSSYSASNGGCVEVGWPESAQVALRDSKHQDGPMLTFGVADWRAFLKSRS